MNRVVYSQCLPGCDHLSRYSLNNHLSKVLLLLYQLTGVVDSFQIARLFSKNICHQ